MYVLNLNKKNGSNVHIKAADASLIKNILAHIIQHKH